MSFFEDLFGIGIVEPIMGLASLPSTPSSSPVEEKAEDPAAVDFIERRTERFMAGGE